MVFKLFLLVGFLISGFTFFKLVRDDIKLISLHLREETVFDIFFLTALASFFGARIFYVATHFGDFGVSFAGVFKAFLFTHFPGFSFPGAVVGGAFFLLWFLKKQNIFRARIFDLGTLSALPVVILGFLGRGNFIKTLLFVVLLVFVVRVYRFRPWGRFNFPGFIFLVFLTVFLISPFLPDFTKERGVLIKLLTAEQITSIIILPFVLYFFTRGLMRKNI